MSKSGDSFLKIAMPKFREFSKTEEAKTWVRERELKDAFIKSNFSRDTVEKIDDGVLRELIHLLWSFNIWTNKDWLLEQMLVSKLSEIRNAFRTLLYGNESLAAKFNKMRKIKMMGAASISEILAHHDNSKYPIWNRRAKAGLVKLGVPIGSLPKSSQINGHQYESYCAIVHRIFNQVSEKYSEISDLLKLDFLLYYISAVYEEKPMIVAESFDHDTVIDQILLLGDGLGFEVKKEFPVTKGCKIDALWRSRIANLGAVAYAFEVHKAGSRDSAILNLQRCKTDPTVQKVIIVSTENEIDKFKGEIASLPEDFRNAVGYFDIKDLQKTLAHQEAIKEILTGIGLMKTGLIVKE